MTTTTTSERARRRGRAASSGCSVALLAALALLGCSTGPDTSLLEAYLEPQRPFVWPGAPLPVPELASGTQLVGMATSDLRDVLGEPALVRTEGGVQYWRYSFTGCTLDLFANRQPDGSAEVVFFDLRPNDGFGNGAAAADCERLAERLEGVNRLPPRRELPPVESF